MNSESKCHVQQCTIDGLNLGDKIFNYKNRLIIGQNQHSKPNFATATVVLSKPMAIAKDGQDIEKYVVEYSETAEETLQVIRIFLSCYQLANNVHMPITSSYPKMSSTLSKPEDAIMWAQSGVVETNQISKFTMLTVDEIWENLNKTIPLYEKVLEIIDQNKKKRLDPLNIALLVYQRALTDDDILQSFLDFVTVIEALISDMGEQKYKFALRTTVFSGLPEHERKDLFDKLYDTYDARSALVHGSDVRAFAFSNYMFYRNFLIQISKKIILNYIDLSLQGKTRKEIIDYIDYLATGFRERVDLSKGIKL